MQGIGPCHVCHDFLEIRLGSDLRIRTEQNSLMSQVWEVSIDDYLSALLVEYTHHGVYHHRRVVVTQLIQHFQKYLHHRLLGTGIQLAQINLVAILVEYLEGYFLGIIG